MLKTPIIGCLALQGCVDRHRPHVEGAGAEFRAVKTAKQFEGVDAFILPGGESTTMLRLINVFNLWDALAEHFKTKPVWGICAGSILMAERAIYNKSSSRWRASSEALARTGSIKTAASPLTSLDPRCLSEAEPRRGDDEWSGQDWVQQKSFGLLPMTAIRNGYGRQLESEIVDLNGYTVSFIRAPVLKEIAPDMQTLAAHHGDPVWVRRGQYMATTFHPELTTDFPSPMHRAFIDLVKNPPA